jgi:hypothetical protein
VNFRNQPETAVATPMPALQRLLSFDCPNSTPGSGRSTLALSGWLSRPLQQKVEANAAAGFAGHVDEPSPN